MKKIPQPRSSSEWIKDVQLYLDEIELIVFTLEEYNYNISIKDKNYEYDTLEELINNLGPKPSYFELEATILEEDNRYPASISISLSKTEVHISYYGEHTAYTAYTRIVEIIKSNQIPLYKVLEPFNIFIAGVLVMFITNLAVRVANPHYVVIAFVVLPILFIVSIVIAVYNHFYRHRVILQKRHSGGFWRRNSDKIRVAIISSIIGMIVYAILTDIISRCLG